MFRKRFMPALALLASLAACDAPSAPREAARLSVLLTDAPGDFERAVVTIQSIYLQGDASADPESGRVYLKDTPVTVDLLDLRNVAMDLVRDEIVPGGDYGQLRMVISGGFIEVVATEDAGGLPTSTRIYASSPQYAASQGVTAHGGLQMPSFAQSGLKINLPGGSLRVDGDQQILLLDFNVAESFGQVAGQSGMWVMTPVIEATDLQLTGTAEFTLALGDGVTLPSVGGQAITLADFRATLDKNGDVLTESFVNSNGTFRVRFNFLVPGNSYPVTFVEPDGLDVTLNPAFPATVSVTAGTTVTQAFTITQAVTTP